MPVEVQAVCQQPLVIMKGGLDEVEFRTHHAEPQREVEDADVSEKLDVLAESS